MRKLNLKGLTNVLSESEMKNVMGGGSNDQRKIDPGNQVPPSGCEGKSAGTPCQIRFSGGTVNSFCWHDKAGKSHCGN
ncbi:MAG: TIGR04149 family rSAM-modified RiPP [Tannerella sp.]|jgi:natural product precursor|nr:TIGR04149 family rSAM-modified RiPP [Tannerella sp.]